MTKPLHLQLTVIAASHGPVVEQLHSQSFELGIAAAKKGFSWLLPTAVGLPHRVAQGADSVGGQVIGVSPAETKLMHDRKYRLPNANYGAILYSGQSVQARDHTLLASADGVIVIGDQACSPQLLALAMELKKPTAVLLAGESQQWYERFIESSQSSTANIIYEQDPKKIATRLASQLS